ncbi:endonuclease domain-containing protein [Confluentibacter lentus]|uniref:endonuclease domain-containing protein n=1 Tax=Confluentibacter lentus TaxID=1699412 RepID=UPI0021CF87A7|nr:endonuclease domain-containing protein [Confluentibacter lentus]
MDFFCNQLQLAIECDGYSHEILEVFEKDVKKTNRLNELGIHVLRFSGYQIMNDMDNVLRAIEDYILDLRRMVVHLPQSLLVRRDA